MTCTFNMDQMLSKIKDEFDERLNNLNTKINIINIEFELHQNMDMYNVHKYKCSTDIYLPIGGFVYSFQYSTRSYTNNVYGFRLVSSLNLINLETEEVHTLLCNKRQDPKYFDWPVNLYNFLQYSTEFHDQFNLIELRDKEEDEAVKSELNLNVMPFWSEISKHYNYEDFINLVADVTHYTEEYFSKRLDVECIAQKLQKL